MVTSTQRKKEGFKISKVAHVFFKRVLTKVCVGDLVLAGSDTPRPPPRKVVQLCFHTQETTRNQLVIKIKLKQYLVWCGDSLHVGTKEFVVPISIA